MPKFIIDIAINLPYSKGILNVWLELLALLMHMNKKSLQIKIEISKRIFCFYALLNVLGYNPEIRPVNPVRRKVRAFLKNIIIKSKSDLTGLKELINQPNISKEFWFPLRTWTLCHSQPPFFKELSSYWKNFIDDQMGEVFGRELKNFWKISKLGSLWGTVKNDYLKIRKQCFSNAEIAVKNSLSYLRFKDKELNFKKFIIIPNFLDEYNRGIAPKINDTAYTILGPSKDKNIFPIQRIQHEFLHSLINPITQKVLGNRVLKPELSFIRESLIHAMVLRINKLNRKYYQKKIKMLKKSKFKDIEKTIAFLKRYEAQQKDFATFFLRNHIWS